MYVVLRVIVFVLFVIKKTLRGTQLGNGRRFIYRRRSALVRFVIAQEKKCLNSQVF